MNCLKMGKFEFSNKLGGRDLRWYRVRFRRPGLPGSVTPRRVFVTRPVARVRPAQAGQAVAFGTRAGPDRTQSQSALTRPFSVIRSGFKARSLRFTISLLAGTPNVFYHLKLFFRRQFDPTAEHDGLKPHQKEGLSFLFQKVLGATKHQANTGPGSGGKYINGCFSNLKKPFQPSSLTTWDWERVLQSSLSSTRSSLASAT